MPGAETIFYRSSNGDQWSLRQEPGADRLSIRHQPNRASGGQPAILEVSDFLSEGHGPQHKALLRLLEDRAGASLVRQGQVTTNFGRHQQIMVLEGGERPQHPL